MSDQKDVALEIEVTNAPSDPAAPQRDGDDAHQALLTASLPPELPYSAVRPVEGRPPAVRRGLGGRAGGAGGAGGWGVVPGVQSDGGGGVVGVWDRGSWGCGGAEGWGVLGVQEGGGSWGSWGVG